MIKRRGDGTELAINVSWLVKMLLPSVWHDSGRQCAKVKGMQRDEGTNGMLVPRGESTSMCSRCRLPLDMSRERQKSFRTR